MWPFTKSESRSNPLENPTIPISDPRALSLIFGDSYVSTTGMAVTEESALSIPAFWAGFNFMSQAFASIPIHVYKNRQDSTEKDYSDNLYKLLDEAPNERWSSYGWRQYSMQRMFTEGRAITLIIRAKSGNKVNRLVPVNPADITIEPTPKRDNVVYKIGKEEFKSGNVIDIPWCRKPDTIGHYRPIHVHRDTIGRSLAYRYYLSRLFGNGGVPPFVIEGPFNSPAAVDRAVKDTMAAMKKAQDEGRPFLGMPVGHTLKQAGISPEQGQMGELIINDIEDYARYFGLNPIFLQHLLRGTFSNMEQAGLQLSKFTFMFWTRLWEDELNLKLFGPVNNNRFIGFNLDGFERGDLASRLNAIAQGIQNALITPDEGRALDNRPPKAAEQPDAGKLHIQGATVPLGEQGNAQKPEPPKEVEPKEDAA